MKTAALATAVLAATLHIGVLAQGMAVKEKPKEPIATTKSKELTAEQKLKALPPDKRAEFEASAKKLGIDPLALAAKDHAAASQQLQAKSTAIAQAMQGIGGSAAGASSAGAAAAKEKEAAARQEAQGKQASSAQEDFIRQQQDAMRKIQELLKAMNETQQATVRKGM